MNRSDAIDGLGGGGEDVLAPVVSFQCVFE